ncbi:choice-of-anchor D domain-containing protein [Myxococcota bacterium]|nr:choice-of-anchor D domain-containing protein [Myxococcota bacterium]
MVLRSTSPHKTALLALGAALALTACEEESIGRLTVKGAFEPDALDFGEVIVGTEKSLMASFKNTGSAVFTIDDVTLSPSFTIYGVKGNLKGKEIIAGTSLELEVAFLATAEGEVNGQLTLVSGDVTVSMDLHAIGVMRRVPVLTMAPSSLSFGAIELGAVARQDVVITNSGTAPGVIDRVTLMSTGADVTGTDEYRQDYGLPITIAEGTSVTVPIIFAPTQEGTRSDVMYFGTSGATAPLELTLTGEGRIPLGEVLCAPSRLSFGPVERGQQRTLTVDCSARGGPARIISANTNNSSDPYFSVAPVGTTDLQPGQAVTLSVTYTPDGLPATHFGTLSVLYSGGSGNSSTDVPLEGEVVPPPPTATAISVILRWNSNNTDVDLHLVEPGALAFSDPTDCFYANSNPDWGVSGDTSDDPFLDVDDVDGFGPENINLNSTAAGNYRVLVHYFSDHNQGPTTATVEVYVAGNLAGTFSRQLDCDNLWTVGTVNWNGNGGTFSPSTTTLPQTGQGSCL